MPVSFPRDTCSRWHIRLPLAIKNPINPDVYPTRGTTGFPVPPHASLCSIFYHFSANKIPLISACVPAFDFYPSAEQGPSPPENAAYQHVDVGVETKAVSAKAGLKLCESSQSALPSACALASHCTAKVWTAVFPGWQKSHLEYLEFPSIVLTALWATCVQGQSFSQMHPLQFSRARGKISQRTRKGPENKL